MMDATTAQWIIGGLIAGMFGIVIALVGAMYGNHSREIHKLREWRHEHADPAIRLAGYLDERVKRIERRLGGRSRRSNDGE